VGDVKEDTRKPGLHKVGPNPWDWEYKPEVGQRVLFVGKNGEEYGGVIKDFTEDEATGEITLNFAQFPDAPKWIEVPES
jgi:hypothetical protein